MANIGGITIKNINYWNGIEGTNYQGNIYLDEEKAGWYSDDTNGGEPIIEYDTDEQKKEIELRIKKFFYKYPQMFKSEDIFFFRLIKLIIAEKEYKEALREGYASNMISENPLKTSFNKNLDQYIFTEEPMAIIKEYQEKGYKNITVFRSLNDFAIKIN